MELARRVEIYMAIKTGDAQTGFESFAIVSGVELFLRKLHDQHAKAVKLYRRHESSEEAIKIIHIQHFTLRDIAQFRVRRQKDGRREFRKKAVRKIKIHIEAFKTREHLNLNLGENLPADFMFDMRETVESSRQRFFVFDFVRLHLPEGIPR